jgi:hypothetical protein
MILVNSSIQLINNRKYKYKTNNHLKLEINTDIKTKKINSNNKNLILHKTGIEWISRPDILLYYSLRCVSYPDAKLLIDELKDKKSIRLFECDSDMAIFYRDTLNKNGFYSEII